MDYTSIYLKDDNANKLFPYTSENEVLMSNDRTLRETLSDKQDKLIPGTPNVTIGEDGRTLYVTGGGGSTVSVEQVQTSGTEIAKVTIDGDATSIYAPTSGGSTVSVEQVQKNGTEIASITVDGTKTSIYTPSLANYLDKTYIGENKLAGKVTVGSCSTNLNNAYLHQRNVGTSSSVVTNTAYNGACFAVNSDGSAAFFHKTYSDSNGGGARNSAVLRFFGKRNQEGGRLQFGVNANANVAESDFKNVAMVDDIPVVSDTYSATSSDAMSGIAVAAALKTVPGGGSTVSVEQIQSTGTEIAKLSIDGNTTSLYAPQGGGGEFDYPNAVATTEISDFATEGKTVLAAINELNAKISSIVDGNEVEW